MGSIRADERSERDHTGRLESDEEDRKGGVVAGLVAGRPVPVPEQRVEYPEGSEGESYRTEIRGAATESAGGGEEGDDGDQRQDEPDAGHPEGVAEAQVPRGTLPTLQGVG